MTQHESSDPHGRQPVLREGRTDVAALVLLHGRGGTAEGMLELARGFDVPGMGLVAPQAAGNTWYPRSFLSPLGENQPDLDSAIRRVESVVSDLLASGLASGSIAVLGFSQGACLALEFVARHPRRYGAVMGLTGGLIGPPGTPRDYSGSLEDTPIFLGANDPDPHVPFARVRETEAVLAGLGGRVELRRYPGLPHAINEDEVDACRGLIEAMLESQGGGR